MKLGILLDTLIPGGVQKSAIEEYQYFKKKHYDVKIYVLIESKSDYKYQDLINQSDIVNLYEYYPPLFKRNFKFPLFHFLTFHHFVAPFFVHRYFKNNKVDILISHNTTTTFSAVSIRKKLNIPYIYFLWDPMIYILKKVYSGTIMRLFFFVIVPILDIFERRNLKYSSLVLTCSRVHTDLIKKRYNKESIIVQPGCYPVSQIDSNKEKIMLAFTRWDYDKHPLFLLEIIKRLQEIKLVIAGKWTSQKDFDDFKKRITKENLGARVIIHDFLTKDKIVELSLKSLIWIHPNFEAFGMGGLEAAACGCPIIIPDGSGVTEIFKNNEHGYFPKELDIDSISAFIKKLIDNPALSAKMGYNAWLMAKKYTWDYHSQCIENQFWKIEKK